MEFLCLSSSLEVTWKDLKADLKSRDYISSADFSENIGGVFIKLQKKLGGAVFVKDDKKIQKILPC